MDIYYEIEMLQKRCERILKTERNKHSKYKRGKLHIKRINGRYQFYRFYGNKEHGIKRNRDLLEDLIRKEFTQQEIAYMEKVSEELGKLLKRLEKHYQARMVPPISDDKLLAAGMTPQDVRLTKEQVEWMNRDYERYDEHLEDLRFQTKRGLWVLSKSEQRIAERLDALGIPYIYDAKFTVNGHTKDPDFIILKPDGSYIIWEHFGMDSEKYMERNKWKIFDYAKAGYTTEYNLIITFEDSVNKNFDLVIDDLLRKYAM